jgi:hypothetical protein
MRDMTGSGWSGRASADDCSIILFQIQSANCKAEREYRLDEESPEWRTTPDFETTQYSRENELEFPNKVHHGDEREWAKMAKSSRCGDDVIHCSEILRA